MCEIASYRLELQPLPNDHSLNYKRNFKIYVEDASNCELCKSKRIKSQS